MTKIRPFLNLKLITIFTLTTLFMTTTTTTTAFDLITTFTTCPCNFLEALLLAKKQAKQIGGSFHIDQCGLGESEIEAEGGENSFCQIEFEAEFEDESWTCGYEFQCGEVVCEEDSEIDPQDNSFALVLDLTDLTEAEFEACRQKIQLISHLIFGVECSADE